MRLPVLSLLLAPIAVSGAAASSQVESVFASAMVWETWQHGENLPQVQDFANLEHHLSFHSVFFRLAACAGRAAHLVDLTLSISHWSGAHVASQLWLLQTSDANAGTARKLLPQKQVADQASLTSPALHSANYLYSLQECGGTGGGKSEFSSFTIAALEVPNGAKWTVNQVLTAVHLPQQT